ncbi:MAG: dephospho-CoA kinase [Candidatus Nitrohelix vancouverensis]|uniref:Dephospho-CoA kinase n=1 Tax=Candidatus Nitrohelix vancouverensis TaxID=2705534 RepID=A0A7T0G426_9BACT|nr:MAG: dephospho-CoA kinase [Candidatus Nitrohelix vancouverensis]
MLIGLTGSIGSGKTQVANLMRDLGARVIDADIISRELTLPGHEGWKQIREQFGDDVLDSGNRLDRKKMAERVFNDPSAKKRLEAILHPLVFQEEKKLYEKLIASDPSSLVVIDAALLIESGNHVNMDQVVLVHSPKELAIQRVMARNGWPREKVIERLNSQMPFEEKSKFADFIIHNDGTLEELQSNTLATFRSIAKLAKQ